MTRIYQADAFTNRAFGGNPAAVCPLETPASAEWMQNVALEMNLSETAFLVRRGDGAYDLRWFTPAKEVDLCGHATLASAHVLWETQALGPEEEARFHTRSGLLTARRDGDSIVMDFPALPTDAVDPPAALQRFLGCNAAFFGRSRFDFVVELGSEAEVRALCPDFAAIADDEARGVIVTAPGETHDMVSRYFAPSYGIDEDPVTGSAHACLAAYWGPKLGQETMTAFQASARGGEMKLRLRGDRVELHGQAVTTLRGELLV